jgi:hypothetical protein
VLPAEVSVGVGAMDTEDSADGEPAAGELEPVPTPADAAPVQPEASNRSPAAATARTGRERRIARLLVLITRAYGIGEAAPARRETGYRSLRGRQGRMRAAAVRTPVLGVSPDGARVPIGGTELATVGRTPRTAAPSRGAGSTG